MAEDRIRISGIAATGFHGVFDHERREGQTFIADVVLHLDTRPAAAGDDLSRTVDYGEVAKAVAGVITGEPADLIETVAERIAAVVLTATAVTAVDVTVHKPSAPIPVPFEDVTVEIHRSRTHASALVVQPAPVPVAVPATGEILLPADPPHRVPEPPAPEPVPVPVLDPTPVHEPARAPDQLDVPPVAPVDVVIALGSNIGTSRETLRSALVALDSVAGLELTAVGPLARTAPVGGPDQDDYLNTVVVGRTTLSPRALLHACQDIEAAHGRVREQRWGPRTLDIDLIVHGSTQAVTDDLELPHPRANQRAFVLAPWAHLQPDAVLPGLGGGPVTALAETAPDRAGIRWMALDWVQEA